MTFEKAVAINDRLVDAFLSIHGMRQSPVPSLAGVSLKQAAEATQIVIASGTFRNPDGSTSMLAHLDLSVLRRIYAVAVVAHENIPMPVL